MFLFRKLLLMAAVGSSSVIIGQSVAAQIIGGSSDADIALWQNCRIAAGQDLLRQKACNDRMYASDIKGLAASETEFQVVLAERVRDHEGVQQGLTETRQFLIERREDRKSREELREYKQRKAFEQQNIERRMADIRANYSSAAGATQSGYQNSFSNSNGAAGAGSPSSIASHTVSACEGHGELLLFPPPGSDAMPVENPAYPRRCLHPQMALPSVAGAAGSGVK